MSGGRPWRRDVTRRLVDSLPLWMSDEGDGAQTCSGKLQKMREDSLFPSSVLLNIA